MLIRSQDKTTLFDLRNRVLTVTQDNAIACSETLMPPPSSICVIARYSTQEKALRVLRVIEMLYDNIERTRFGLLKNFHTDYTFQMPQDEEVEHC